MEASAVPREAPAGVSTFVPPHLLRLASDARLVTLIREGRPAAFEIAYNRHHRGILSFCRHMLADPQEAEDAVQQTFLSAYNDLISTTKPIHLRAWLFTIARNRCYSILRARREQPTAEVQEPASEGLAAQVQVRQDLRDLVRDMRRLPKDQRAALVLAEIDSLSHEQIGEVLGVPREKVKALVFQARESLLASRAARETDCTEIREQLATLRGGGLRRTHLRRHLHECAGCREYRKQVERQRRRLALIIPVAPTLALKEGIIAGTIGGGAAIIGGGIVAGGGGLLAGSLLKSSATKTAMGLMLAGVGTAGTIVAARDLPQQLGLTTQGHQVAPGTGAGGLSATSQPSQLGGPPAVVRLLTTTDSRALGSGASSRLLDPFGPLAPGTVVLAVPGSSPGTGSGARSTPSATNAPSPASSNHRVGGQGAGQGPGGSSAPGQRGGQAGNPSVQAGGYGGGSSTGAGATRTAGPTSGAGGGSAASHSAGPGSSGASSQSTSGSSTGSSGVGGGGSHGAGGSGYGGSSGSAGGPGGHGGSGGGPGGPGGGSGGGGSAGYGGSGGARGGGAGSGGQGGQGGQGGGGQGGGSAGGGRGR